MTEENIKMDDLKEILWLQVLADRLSEFYVDVRVDMVAGDDYVPMILVHNIPIDTDEAEELLLAAPLEYRDARASVGEHNE